MSGSRIGGAPLKRLLGRREVLPAIMVLLLCGSFALGWYASQRRNASAGLVSSPCSPLETVFQLPCTNDNPTVPGFGPFPGDPSTQPTTPAKPGIMERCSKWPASTRDYCICLVQTDNDYKACNDQSDTSRYAKCMKENNDYKYCSCVSKGGDTSKCKKTPTPTPFDKSACLRANNNDAGYCSCAERRANMGYDASACQRTPVTKESTPDGNPTGNDVPTTITKTPSGPITPDNPTGIDTPTTISNPPSIINTPSGQVKPSGL